MINKSYIFNNFSKSILFLKKVEMCNLFKYQLDLTTVLAGGRCETCMFNILCF